MTIERIQLPEGVPVDRGPDEILESIRMLYGERAMALPAGRINISASQQLEVFANGEAEYSLLDRIGKRGRGQTSSVVRIPQDQRSLVVVRNKPLPGQNIAPHIFDVFYFVPGPSPTDK